MKLGTIIKQGFYSLFAHITLWTSAVGMVIFGIFQEPCDTATATATATAAGSAGAGGEFFMSLMMLSIVWGIYRALYEAYGDLDRVSIGWVMLLFICSGLSNLRVTLEYFSLIVVYFTGLSPFGHVSFKNGIGWVEICMIQLALAIIALVGAQWLITLRSGRVLAKRSIVAYQSARKR